MEGGSHPQKVHEGGRDSKEEKRLTYSKIREGRTHPRKVHEGGRDIKEDKRLTFSEIMEGGSHPRTSPIGREGHQSRKEINIFQNNGGRESSTKSP